MANKKNKKRPHSRTVERKRQIEQDKLADEKARSKKKMDPKARVLLYFDIVFLAVISLLDSQELISGGFSGLCTAIGIVLLLAALWFQFGPKKDSNSIGKGPRL